MFSPGLSKIHIHKMKLQKTPNENIHTHLKKTLQSSSQATLCCFACTQPSGMGIACAVLANNFFYSDLRFLCLWQHTGIAAQTGQEQQQSPLYRIHPCSQNYRGWILQKETKNQERPTCTPVLPLPNGRDGPTTATSKGSPLAPCFELLPGLNFFPSCVLWASQMHPGAQHPKHCTPAQLNSSGSKGDVKNVLLSN